MFGWFKQKQDPKLTHAFEMGQRAAQAFVDDLQGLIGTRFKTVSEGYLGVLQGQLNNSLSRTDAPPLLVGRIEYNVFLENVAELRSKMTNEICTTLSKWLDLASEMQSREQFLELVRVRVDDFCNELSLTGLQRLTDMAHALKAADNQWRVAYPELAVRFPPAP